jgi:hypothetical protein
MIFQLRNSTITTNILKERLWEGYHLYSAGRDNLKSHSGTDVCISLTNEDNVFNVFLLLVDHITEQQK